MTEPPSPKNTDAGSVEPDKTAVVSPPDKTASSQSETGPAADESDRTMVVADDAPASDEEGTVLAPPARGRARLVLREADGKEQEIVLVQPEVTIGRSSGCDIVLQAPTVSRVHARVVQQALGSLLIPVGTRQNTYVNDELVSQPRLLRDGDRLQLANEQLVFRFDAGPALLDQSPSRRTPMLLAFAAALATVAAIFVVWRQTHPSPAIPVKKAPQKEATRPPVADLALEQQAQQEARLRQLEEEARQAKELREEEERRRLEQEQRQIETRVREYVYKGDVAFLEKRYTTPPDGSAVFAYREALRLDPTNERALEQTAKIIDQYLSWAEDAAARGNRSRARQHYERAAYVQNKVPSAGTEAITARLMALRGSLGIE